MHTKAVFRATQALNEAGFHVLRFNFRGVGASTGVHDHGVGEQDDAQTALDWLSTQFPDLPLLLGGFSFGSIVALRVGERDPRVRALIALGLPISLRDVGLLGHEETRGSRPLLLVQGEEDEFGNGEALSSYAEGLGGGVHVVRIPGAGHFFHEDMDGLKRAIHSFFGEQSGGVVFPLLPRPDTHPHPHPESPPPTLRAPAGA
jgi:uncharacterized protein